MTDINAKCAALPGALLTFPFDEETAVYKVGGKIFAIVGGSKTSVSLKAEPEDVIGLVQTHESIGPGYHLSKKHWVTVDLTGPLPAGLLDELIQDSYDAIVDKLPARDRP